VSRITLLTQPDCGLCDHAKQVLAKIAGDLSLRTRQEISKGFSDLTDILVVWRLRRALLRQ